MARPQNETLILGADGMNRKDPTPYVRGGDAEPWPMLEIVDADAVELPVIQGRLAFRDPAVTGATTWPRRKSSL